MPLFSMCHLYCRIYVCVLIRFSHYYSVMIKTDSYANIYPSEMAPLIKVKVINKVNGQFGQQINLN